MRYLWAAYKKGALAVMGEPFDGDELRPADFEEAFLEHVGANFNGGWVAEKDGTPLGLILGWVRGRVIEVGDMIWFPWASARNVYEAVVRYMDDMRGDYVVLEFARLKDKKFFERVASHGIMRKVGHAHSIYPDGPAVIFETKGKE